MSISSDFLFCPPGVSVTHFASPGMPLDATGNFNASRSERT